MCTYIYIYVYIHKSHIYIIIYNMLFYHILLYIYTYICQYGIAVFLSCFEISAASLFRGAYAPMI